MYILEALQVFQQNYMIDLVKHYVFDYNVPVHTLSCTSWVQHWKHLFLGPLRTGCGRNLPIGYNTAMLDCCCLSSCSGNSQGRAGQLGWRWRASCFRLTMPTHTKKNVYNRLIFRIAGGLWSWYSDLIRIRRVGAQLTHAYTHFLFHSVHYFILARVVSILARCIVSCYLI